MGAAERETDAVPPYDVPHYPAVLHTASVAPLRTAFAPGDVAQRVRPAGQAGLFDRPLQEIAPG